MSPSRPRTIKYFNSDICLAFDLRNYDQENRNNITCHTDAYSICDDSTVVLIDGYEDIDGTSSDSSDVVCEYKQCPLQCPDGNGGFERFSTINLEYLDTNTDCIRAIVEKFANDNVLFTDYFIDSWVKMITTGYKSQSGTQLETIY